jgi:hypothetical protein
MRRALLFFSLLGTVAFAGGWLLSYLQPLLVERAARQLIRTEVQALVERKLDALDDSRIGALAQQALRSADIEIDRGKLRAEIAVTRHQRSAQRFGAAVPGCWAKLNKGSDPTF